VTIDAVLIEFVVIVFFILLAEDSLDAIEVKIHLELSDLLIID
jgi:hypothetical protein